MHGKRVIAILQIGEELCVNLVGSYVQQGKETSH